MFLGICLGLIFERRIRMLHVGPPCSSFSMSCNGCPSTMMRSEEHPEGLPFLSQIRREKVTLGNALAEVAVTRDLFAAILDRIARLAIPPPLVT